MSTEDRLAELERQLSTLAVLQSVYCMEGEFTATERTSSLLDAFSNGEDLSASVPLASPLQATLNIAIAEDSNKLIGLSISWKPSSQVPDACQIRLLRPEWLPRRLYERVLSVFEQELASLALDEAEDEVAVVAFAVEKAKELALKACADEESDSALKSSASSADSDSLV